jgi:LysR family transcriptional regulator, transcription activator of glutamate synthase operon
MELDQLRSFVAVAEVRSFTRAAALAHLSQPAISRQIARLEGELGVRLFERYGRRVECTPDGKLLLPLAKAIVSRADDATRMMREHAGMVSSRVRVGSTGTVFGHLLSPVLASFIKTYPKVHLDLIERDDTLLEEGVFNGELDCAIITAWGSSRAAVTHLLTEEILLVVRRDHRFAREASVSLADLADEPFLFPGHSLNTANLLMEACRRAGFEPKVPYRANYVELSKALVRQGLGVALLPRMFVTPQTLDGLVTISLNEHLTRDLDLIYSNERPLPVAARSLALHIKASLAEPHGTET